MNSMASNGVWDFVKLPNGEKAIGSKWVFKTKKTHSATFRDRKQDLQLKDLLKMKESTTRRPFLLHAMRFFMYHYMISCTF